MNDFTKTMARIETARRIIAARYPRMTAADIAEKVRAIVPTPSFEDVDVIDSSSYTVHVRNF